MNKKMISVLLYNYNEPFPEQGGMERITDSLARGLMDKGIKTILMCSQHNHLGKKYEAPIPIYYLPENDKQKFVLNLIKQHNITHIIDQTEGGIIGKFGIFKKRDYSFDNITLIAVQHNSARAIMRNFRIAMSRHCSNIFSQFAYNNIILPLRKIHSKWLIRVLYKELCKNYDKIVMLSDSFINDFIWFYKKADVSKLSAIPNMNSFEHINVVKKENRVLFVGRLINNVKGCDKLLRIWKETSKNVKGWHLDIIGDGQDKAKLEKYAIELGLQNYTFHGYKDPRPFYEKAKIFCMTSVYEGFGLVLTEAMQHGVTPIAFNSFSSVKDIIKDGVNGYLINPFDEKVYSQKLSELMSNAPLLSNFGEKSCTCSKKFDRDTVIKQWLQLIMN